MTPRAAAALAASARKSAPSGHLFDNTSDDTIGARAADAHHDTAPDSNIAVSTVVAQLHSDLSNFKRGKSSNAMPCQGSPDERERKLYFRLRNCRDRYRNAGLTSAEARLLIHHEGLFYSGSVTRRAGTSSQTPPSQWYWTFKWPFNIDNVDIESEDFHSEQAATNELLAIRSQLFPGWFQRDARRSILVRLKHVFRAQRDFAAVRASSQLLASAPTDAAVYASRIFDASLPKHNELMGFHNLGNT